MNWILIPILVLLDQLTKHFFTTPKDFGFFAITPVTNTGTLWGLFANANLLFIILTIIVLISLYFISKKELTLQQELSLVTAGALGNLLDRIFFGHVFDFLNFKFWPVFNLADSYLVVGIIFILFKLIRQRKSLNNPQSK